MRPLIKLNTFSTAASATSSARNAAGRNLAKEPVDVSSLLEETIRQARQLDSQRGDRHGERTGEGIAM